MARKDRDVGVAGRYSMTKEERASVLQKFNLEKPITLARVRKIAAQEGLAAKVVHDALSRKGATIVDRRSVSDVPPRKRKWEEAEALFETPVSADASTPPPSSAAPPAGGAVSADDLEALAEMEAEVNTLREEARLAAEEAARQTEAAKEAMQRVAALRRRTKVDREELSSLRGSVESLHRQREIWMQAEVERQKRSRAVWAEVKSLGKLVKSLIAALEHTESLLAEERKKR